jgi:DNA gyrase/topoisomerase IV subunit B
MYLQGKPLNVDGCSAKQISENKEVNALKLIIGLKHDMKYTSLNQLRYGRILILSDADLDGESHTICRNAASSSLLDLAIQCRLHQNNHVR